MLLRGGVAAMILAAVVVLGATAPTSVDDSVTLLGDSQGDEGDIFSFSAFVDALGVDALTYTWDFGDGSGRVTGVTQTAVAHRYKDDGTYTLSVEVGDGATLLTAGMTVEVRNVAPTINLLSDEADGETVRLEADARDPGDDELTYIWDLGDGTPPQSGVDLRSITHTYGQPGEYTVTLTVRDEDGGETTKVLGVTANPGFLGRMAGEVQVPFAGESGKSSLMNALPGSRALPIGEIPLFTGSAPMGGGVADLSDAFGICMINAGFWDDENKAHINFVMTPNSDSVFTPRTYIVGWDLPDNDRIPPDQLIVNALILEIEPSYEDTKAGAEEMRIFDLASGIRGLRDLVGAAVSGRLGRLFGGGGGQQADIGSGRNYQLTSYAGYVRTTHVTHERIHGEVDVVLRGAWMGGEGSGEVVYVEVEGEFAWEMDEVARANLLRCGDRRFAIDTHTPWVEAENVDFENPAISVTMTLPYQRASVTDRSFEIGWLDASSGFHPIEGEILHDDDDLTIHFVPDEDLEDAVFYMGRVRGGEAGIRGEGGEVLPDDHEWRFSTVPDMVIDRTGSSGQAFSTGGGGVRAASVVAAAGLALGPAIERAGWLSRWRTASAPDFATLQTQEMCDRTDEDEWTETPTVDVVVYQSACNQKLIPGKPALARVYLNWTYPEGRLGVDKYTASVILNAGGVEQNRTRTLKRQVRYTPWELKDARNSVNFDWVPPASGGPYRIEARVEAVSELPSASVYADPTIATQVRTLLPMERQVDFTFDVIFPQVGSWRSEGVPATQINRWTTKGSSIHDAVQLATQSFPVLKFAARVNRVPLVLPGEPGIGDHVTTECAGNVHGCMHYQIDDEVVKASDWLEAALISHYTKDGAARPQLIVAIVPPDYGGAWGGITKHHVGLLDNLFGGLVHNRTPAVILVKTDSNPVTLTHELGHFLGLTHRGIAGDPLVAVRDPAIEGFRLDLGVNTNKSFAEGNGRAESLLSLMAKGGSGTTLNNVFIWNRQYEALLKHIETEGLWTASLGRPDRRVFASPAPSPWLLVASARAGEWSRERERSIAAAAPRQAGPHLVVSGYVTAGDHGYLAPVATSDGEFALPQPGAYRIRLTAIDGTTLQEVPFALVREYWDWEEEQTLERSLHLVDVRVPVTGVVGAVELVDPSGRVLARREAGVLQPQVRFLEQDGRAWRAGESIRWEGSDPDGDELFYTLSYRANADDPWRTIVSDARETETLPDAGWLAPGSAPQLRLTASDGVRSTGIETDNVEPGLRPTALSPGEAEPVSIQTLVDVQFNAPLADLDPDALTLMGPDGARVEGTLRAEGDVLRFEPAGPLLSGALYEVRMTTGMRDDFGNRPAEDVSWSFQTEVDTEAPYVERTVPREGSIATPRQAAIYVWFGEAMDPASIERGIVVRDADGQGVPATFRYESTQRLAVGTFPEPLAPRATYQLVVTQAVADLSGNGVIDDVVTTFTTAGEGGPLRPPTR